MSPLHLTPSPPRLSPFLPLPKLSHPSSYGGYSLTQHKKLRRRGLCKASLQQDAPFAIAIGACMLNSLIFSDVAVSSSDDEDAAISSTDARFTVMTIIGFIPYFNWLSWVFALMDTGKRRYAVYTLVYLAPYIRTNLSLSPEESWLPIASIVLCVVHIQLEASIRSGDIDGFNFFNEAAKRLGLVKKHSDEIHNEAQEQGDMKLPLGQQSRDEIRRWRVSRKPSRDPEHVDEDGDLDDDKQH
ncbi:Transthyretin [Bienertia sinuspersici]